MRRGRSWWLRGFGNERIVLTTSPEDFDEAEPLHEYEVRSLLCGWFADRHASQQLAALYAELRFAPETPTTWKRHELDRVVGGVVADACAAGWLVALRHPSLGSDAKGGLPRKPQPPAPGRPHSVEPPPGSSPVGPQTSTRFEVRFVDEIGEPIGGAAVQFDVDGRHARVTGGSGHAQLDEARSNFGSVNATDVTALREQLRPRWDLIREDDWLEPEPEHTFAPLRGGREIRAQLLSETLHTVVVQPWCIRARLIGMYFDTNKCFLLPTAMPHIRSVKRLYDDNPDTALLIVGHTDTSGTPLDNDPLSVERAESVAAYLHDDVDAWLAWYNPSVPWWKRWGAHEDELMIRALPDFPVPSGDTSADAYYQRTRGFPVTGTLDGAARSRLVGEYMAIDGTSLPTAIPVTVHGCGENFPLEDGDPGFDGENAQHDRRVELYFFDRALGVQPPPPARNSAPGSETYPEWIRRARETHDFKQFRENPFIVGVYLGDEERDDDGDLVILDGSGEPIVRRRIRDADHEEGGFVYFWFAPDTLPATVSAYWDKGYDGELVLAPCSPAAVSRALRREHAAANDLAFGNERE